VPVSALPAVVGAVWLAAAVALGQAAGDANCDTRIDSADGPAIEAATFEGSGCAGADVNRDAVISAADLSALVSVLANGDPLPTPTPTVALATCPRQGAALVVRVENLATPTSIAATISGRLVDASCVGSAGLADTYQVSVSDTPQTILGLAPGTWVHTLAIDDPATGQQQHRTSLLLANSAPTEMRFTAFPSVTTVRSAEDTRGTGSLRDALTWAASAPKPALIQFDDATFPAGQLTVITLTAALPKLDSNAVTIDALDANGAPGFRVVDANGLDIPALAITGGSNTIVGLRLRHTGAHNRDVISISGPGATSNLVERCIIENSTTGDGIGIDNNAGSDFESTVNIVRSTEVSGADDKGIKVTTNSFARLENNWVHDNLNGGVQATLSGHVYAVDNLIERSGGASAQNGLAANGAVSKGTPIATELHTDGNIARFNAANGIAVLGFSLGFLSNDYLSANGSSGLRVYNREIYAAYATVEGVAAVCNGVDGAVVTDTSMADFGGPKSPGNNAFTQNNLAAGGANLRNGAGERVYALNNQWEHCGRETLCNDADIAAYDISDHGVHTLFAPAQAQRAQRAPIVSTTRPAKAAVGELVRIFGFGFNVIDGHAAGTTCPDVATRNRCLPLRGNCVHIGGVAAPVEAVTPTMLVVRMPFSCIEPVPLTVETQGGGSSTVLTFCTND
jgi:hypothetical protein